MTVTAYPTCPACVQHARHVRHARHHPTCLDKRTAPRHMTKPRHVRHLMSYDVPTFPHIPRHCPTLSDMSDNQGSTTDGNWEAERMAHGAREGATSAAGSTRPKGSANAISKPRGGWYLGCRSQNAGRTAHGRVRRRCSGIDAAERQRWCNIETAWRDRMNCMTMNRA